ncbi:MAG: hypothetical protein IPJ34_27850 [Myxococcales bacterium]|nr:hypothetical protein [Myxococcales bacterium]
MTIELTAPLRPACGVALESGRRSTAVKSKMIRSSALAGVPIFQTTA